MKRVGIAFLAAIAAAGVIGVSANPVPSSTQAVSSKPSGTSKSNANPTPFVIPSLQEWEGAKGQWKLSAATRIVVDAAYANGGALDAGNMYMRNPSNLQQFAATFQSDISAVTGIDVEVVVSSKYGKNDIFLTLGAEKKDPKLNHEGYLLDISNKGITVQGVTSRGSFWGTRSLLQMLILADEDGYALPQGHARDYPNYNERLFMQDIARKPIPMSDLEEYATLTSFYKYNTLLQHYNDNPAVQVKGVMKDWQEKYAGFRLRSDNPEYSMYASNDTAYTKQDMRQFQDFVKARGLDLIPEIDAPAHSLCFTKFHPEWSINSDTARGDWLDLGNPAVEPFLKGVWTEFVDWFDSSQISIGADEYDPTKGDLARTFINSMHDFLAGLNRTTRMWGSEVRLPGTVEIDSDIVTTYWDASYSNANALVARGQKVSNLNAPDAYLVPRTYAYEDFIDSRKIYNLWEPWVFDILDKTNTSRNLRPDEPLLTGGGFANWNDFLSESVTRVELYDRVSKAADVFGEKLWAGAKNIDQVSYDKWAPLAKKLRENIPGITLRRRPASKGQYLISYDFEDGAAADGSDNANNGELHNGATVVEAGEGHGRAVKMTADSYISTPIEGIAYPYAVGMWVKPSGAQQAKAVLLESGDGRVLVSNSTSPTVTFVQDDNEYNTQIILPADQWSHLAFSADGTTTRVFYNFKHAASVNYYNPRWDVLQNSTMQVTAPLRTIGSANGNSFSGLVDGFFAMDRASYAGEMAFIGKHYANALP
ncbi:hypothetical protein LPJ63_005234 [Coemansia sp. RSA 2711]|nr:hypothetical protein LPJ63_005234 [Coemansia sp. RSA 2711]